MIQFDSFFDYAGSDARSFLARQDRGADSFSRDFFDAVAPVAIYHFADVSYKQKAKEGMVKLCELCGREWVNDTFFEGASGEPLDEFLDDEILSGEIVEEINAYQSREWYNYAFAFITENSVDESLLFYVDDYGGFNYKKGDEVLFGSDDVKAFPWVETADLIHEKIAKNSSPEKTVKMGL